MLTRDHQLATAKENPMYTKWVSRESTVIATQLSLFASLSTRVELSLHFALLLFYWFASKPQPVDSNQCVLKIAGGDCWPNVQERWLGLHVSSGAEQLIDLSLIFFFVQCNHSDHYGCLIEIPERQVKSKLVIVQITSWSLQPIATSTARCWCWGKIDRNSQAPWPLHSINLAIKGRWQKKRTIVARETGEFHFVVISQESLNCWSSSWHTIGASWKWRDIQSREI